MGRFEGVRNFFEGQISLSGEFIGIGISVEVLRHVGFDFTQFVEVVDDIAGESGWIGFGLRGL